MSITWSIKLVKPVVTGFNARIMDAFGISMELFDSDWSPGNNRDTHIRAKEPSNNMSGVGHSMVKLRGKYFIAVAELDQDQSICPKSLVNSVEEVKTHLGKDKWETYMNQVGSFSVGEGIKADFCTLAYRVNKRDITGVVSFWSSGVEISCQTFGCKADTKKLGKQQLVAKPA